MHNQHFRLPSNKIFFGIAFVFSFLIAVFFQKIALPMVPDMHAGAGLLKNDAFLFHNAAIKLSEKIQTQGWSEWSLFPFGLTGNVSILSIVYTYFGPHPVLFLPITTLLHALSATIIYRIGFKLTNNDTGRLAGLIAGLCFTVFPSSLQWYAQNHKDSFSIAGVLILLDIWLAIISLNEKKICIKELTKCIFAGATGIALIGIVRPHLVFLVSLGFFSSFITVIVVSVFKKSLSRQLTLKTSLFVAIILGMGICFTHIGPGEQVFEEVTKNGKSAFKLKNFHWESNTYLPEVLDEKVKRLAGLRVYFSAYNSSIGANSNIDSDRLPNSTVEVAKYMPRALVIALFSPFPDTWNDRVTVTRLVGAIETCIWYLIFAGIFITLKKYANVLIFACIAFCLPIISLLTFVNPNIGTLYRERYGFWQIILLLGAIGWATLFMHYLNKADVKKRNAVNENIDKLYYSNKSTVFSTGKLLSAGFIVTLITTACYLGFFARDLILISEIGLTHRLDAFFTAMMIPMFLVTCFAMPIGDTVTKLFISANTHLRKQSLIDAIVSWGFLWLLVITFIMALLAPDLVSLILTKESDTKEATTLLRIFSPILFLSAWTMTGNAALNSLGLQKHAALGQLITPAIVISIILMSDQNSLLLMSVLGMLAGMTLNVLWIIKHLQLKGFRLMPRRVSFEEIKPLLGNYGKLALSALLPALLIPINYAFAASVGEGSLSAWAFSSKIVLLFAGIATVVATSVFLPHFSNAHQSQDNPQLSFKLPLIISLISGIFLTFICFIFVEPLVAMTLGINAAEAKIQELITIIQIGLIQIPVMLGITVFNKHAIAGNRASLLLTSSVMIFTINLLGNWIMVPKFGVTGVAISALAGVLTGLVFLYVQKAYGKNNI
jgi:putative peptidoglycan lipid II flippase